MTQQKCFCTLNQTFSLIIRVDIIQSRSNNAKIVTVNEPGKHNYSTRFISLLMSMDIGKAVTFNLTERLRCSPVAEISDSRGHVHSIMLTKKYSQHQPQKRTDYPWDDERVGRICRDVSDQLRALCFQSILIHIWILLQVKVLQHDHNNTVKKC